MSPGDPAMRLSSPMFISARLMAAVKVGDDGSTLHIEPVRRDSEERIVWRYVIEDGDRTVLDEAADLRSGAGDPVDPRKAMATLVGYLGAAADRYSAAMRGRTDDDGELFPPDVMEWAYTHDDELASLGLDLNEPAVGHDLEKSDVGLGKETSQSGPDGGDPRMGSGVHRRGWPFLRFAGDAPVPAGWTTQPAGLWRGRETEVVYHPSLHDVMVVNASVTEDREGDLTAAGWSYEGTDGATVFWVRDRVAAARAALDRSADPPERGIGPSSPDIGGLEL